MKTTPRNKPPKPYPDFPLFAAANGCWVKKIKGKKRSFGPTRSVDDPAAYEASWRDALRNYHVFLERTARGLAYAADPRSLDLEVIVNGFLTTNHARAETGTLKPRSFAEMRKVTTGYRDALGGSTTVGELEDDPAPLQKFIAAMDEDNGGSYGFHSFNRTNVILKSMWAWAAKPETGLLDGKPFRWASLHKKKPIRGFRRQRRLDRAAGVRTTFDADEVAALLEYAPPFTRAMVLLGYYCAYGNADISELAGPSIKVYDRAEQIFVRGRREQIPAGWALIDYPRPKTEIDRFAIVPPEVVVAVRDVEALARPAATPDDHQLVFRTSGGRRMTYDVIHRDESGLMKRTTPTDNVAQHFKRVLASIGRCPAHGWVRRRPFVRGDRRLCPSCGAPLAEMQSRGFYSLRHTATTFAAGSGASSDARNLFEGHAAGGIRQAFYLDPTKLHELFTIAADLRARLMQSAEEGSAL